MHSAKYISRDHYDRSFTGSIAYACDRRGRVSRSEISENRCENVTATIHKEKLLILLSLNASGANAIIINTQRVPFHRMSGSF